MANFHNKVMLQYKCVVSKTGIGSQAGGWYAKHGTRNLMKLTTDTIRKVCG